MGSIVLELQREALDKDADIESLLRKAYVIAKKLKLKEFEDWIRLEQNGYDTREVPEYRYIKGQIKARNPYNGWIPVVLKLEIENRLSNVATRDAISRLKSLYETGNVTLRFMMDSDTNQILSEMGKFDTVFCVQFGRDQIYRIISTIQNKILDWALLLEENGIMGEGLSFTENEIRKAEQTPVINNYTNNFYASVEDIDLQQGISK